MLNRGRHPVWIFLVMAGLLLAGLTWNVMVDFRQNQVREKFLADVDRSGLILKGRLELNERVLAGIVAWYQAAGGRVDRAGFRAFVEPILRDYTFIKALEWIPGVSRARRPSFEARARADGLDSFTFRVREEQGRMVPSPEREQYFPVFFVEPLQGNEAALGFDLASSPKRLRSLEAARDQGRPVATGGITLVQEKQRQAGILIFSPAYLGPAATMEERRQSLAGFALGVYRVGDMMTAILENSRPQGLHLTLYDGRPGASSRLYGQPLANPVLSVERILDPGGRTWTLLWQADAAYAPGGRLLPLAAAAGVLLFFAMVGVLVDILIMRHKVIRDEVDLRTLELQKEVVERRRAESRAEEASRAKSEFLSSMSHELRTPLNAIIGFSELIIDEAGEAGDDELRDGAGRIYHSGRHLLMLINDLLDISRIEAGNFDLQYVPFRLSGLLAEVEDLVIPLVVKHENRFVCRETPDLSLEADPLRLKQMLLNVLSNAAKFTRNGMIELVTEPLGADQVRFRIQDTGPGIPEDKLDTIFNRFAQIHDTRNDAVAGTGLGLPITRDLARLMGGDCYAVKSGQGATIIIDLPSVRPAAAVAPEGLVAEPPPANVVALDRPESGSGAHQVDVLIIDDDAAGNRLLRRSISTWGYSVDVCEDPDQALEQIRRRRPGGILLDIHMPGKNGFALLREIRADAALCHIPVAMISSDPHRKEALRAGAVAMISKPLVRDEIPQMLRDLFAGSVIQQKKVSG